MILQSKLKIILYLPNNICTQIDYILIKKFKLTCILLVANSTPIVDFDSKLNSFRVNLERRLLFPTPESPISTTVTERNSLLA